MTRRRFTWFLVVAAACAVFVVDSLTPADVCVSILYVTIIMIVLRTGVIRDLVAVCIGCVVLTTLSLLLIPGGFLHHRFALIEFALSVFAIVSTSWLGIRVLMTEERARRTQEKVAKISRGISLSELTTSIAHEINQPLAAIVAHAAAARRWLAASPPNLVEARKAVEAISTNGERSGAIINGLKRLISTSMPLRRPFDVSQLITETIDLMRLEIAQSGAEIETSVQRRMPPLAGDKTLIQQAIINLIANSLDAFTDTDPQDRHITISVSVQSDICVMEIKDTGASMDPAVFDRLFEPFFSTKEKGMGIGLAICRSIVEAHDGSIAARANEPTGTILEMRFPRAAATEADER